MPEPTCCVAGDITVTPVPYGFLVGRMIDRPGYGPWWHYINTLADRDQAIRLAKELAKEGGSAAWFSKGGDDYALIARD